MKQLIMVMVTVCAIFSCTKKEKEVDTSDPLPASVFKQVDVLQQPFQIPNTNVVLPKGTQVFIDQAKSEVRVQLPAGYSFYAKGQSARATTSLKTLPVIIIGSYTCKCGGQDGRCNVFHLSVGGFGCLHNSCTGTCSGHFVTIDNLAIEGVLGLDNSKVSSTQELFFPKASVSATGKQDFFNHPIVQSAIAERHRALFKGLSIPPVEGIITDKLLQKDFVLIKSYLYGVAFYQPAPRKALLNFPEVEQIEIGDNKCACSDEGGCRIQKMSVKGALTIHWCEGDCPACVMSV